MDAQRVKLTTAKLANHFNLTAVNRYLLLAGRSAPNPPHAAAAVDRWDRQTDGRSTVS